MFRCAAVLMLAACGGKAAPANAPANTSEPTVATTPTEAAMPSKAPECEPWTPEWSEPQHDRVLFQDPTTELWGYKNTAGAVVLAAQYQQAWSFWPGGFATVLPQDKNITDRKHPFLFIDPTGKTIARAFTFDNGADYYQEGFFRITDAGKRGFMNDRGEIVIAPQYETVFAFCHGKARVEHAGQTFYIDTKGAKTTAPAE